MREVFSEKIGLRDYKVSVEDEKVLEEWHKQIEEILTAISVEHINREVLNNIVRSDREFQQLLKDGKFKRNLDWVFEQLEQSNLDEEDKKLLAIGLWFDREKGMFKFTPLIKRLLVGTNYKMEDVVKKWGLPDCINSAVVTQEMAQQFGVDGAVEAQDNNRFGHRYFKSNSGKVVDVWWGGNRAGLFQSVDDFQKNKSEFGKQKHACAEEEKV